MSGNLRQRARIVRVRRVQHDLAAAAASRAAAELKALESSEERLRLIRNGLGAGRGDASGAALASIGELAMRLDRAREGLGRTITGAKVQVAAREGVRIAARRDQESAERLEEKAASAARRAAERKRPAHRARHPRLGTDGEGQS
ncbi:hypothetical protein ACFQRC_11685 [Enterovirga sp. GCM10030262]|uniref:hypothetical protein n=1 Tax=Enterovirga sp. GCM10030262 TaxID=3273391 RepID=UPI00361A877C